jgi:hypothetical protein
VTTQGQTRGVLDTSTVILLSRIRDATLLPAEPVITAVTLAELSVGPLVARTDEERLPVKHTCNRPRQTLIRFRSMPLQHERSVE